MRHNAPMATKILVVDNYDSFVFNLVQYLQQLGAECTVVRNDAVAAEEASKYDGVLISPGPGTPEKAGISVEMIKYCAQHSIPLFGVCLGHQAIGVAFGATVSRAPELLHGKTSLVYHQQEGVLADIPSPFTATRYHSLCVEKDSVPNTLHITGTTDSGLVMSMEHTTLPIQGVNFRMPLVQFIVFFMPRMVAICFLFKVLFQCFFEVHTCLICQAHQNK